MMYTSRLRKYKHAEEHALARRNLCEKYALSDNPDVMYSFADALYTQFRWADCFAITSRYRSDIVLSVLLLSSFPGYWPWYPCTPKPYRFI